jgi:hypothetical protein
MDEDELETIIAALVKRKWDIATGDAERELIQRMLNGMRYTYEQAGPIWESVDPNGWDATPP